MTDKERLDFLQELTNDQEYTGQVMLRLSESGRGWRLHETSRRGAVRDVRQAIDNFYKSYSGKLDYNKLITVCDKCYCACCWQGQFHCNDFVDAGTIDLPIGVLLKLDLENPVYWK